MASPRQTWKLRGPDWARQIADFEVSPMHTSIAYAAVMGHVPLRVHRLLPRHPTYLAMSIQPMRQFCRRDHV